MLYVLSNWIESQLSVEESVTAMRSMDGHIVIPSTALDDTELEFHRVLSVAGLFNATEKQY